MLKPEKWKANYIKSPYKNDDKPNRNIFIIIFFYTNPVLEPAYGFWMFVLHWEKEWVTIYFSNLL